MLLKILRKLRQSLFSFLILWSLPNLFGQTQLYFDHLDSESGLSQNDVNAIYQDKDGFMWFGTHDGLNKFNGYDFTVFSPDPNTPGSISSNLIFAITGDSEGNLWIGTTGSGLNFFDRSTEKFSHFRYDKNNFKSISNDNIAQLLLDSKNRLWVSTNNGISMTDLNKKGEDLEFQRFYPKSWDNFDKSINTIFEDSKGGIWAGGISDLFKLSRNKQGEFYFKPMNSIIGLPNVNVKGINEDKFANLILSTESGIYRQTKNDDSALMEKLYDGDF
ncbi:MAG: two-component regulator propeller domain-containing protein, partial [Lutimonas sp.]